MADSTKIKANDLQVGEEAVIKGTLGFSKWLTQMLEGEDLKKQIEADKQRGNKYPNMKERCECLLEDAEVVCANPQAPTGLETYLHQHIFPTKINEKTFRVEKLGGLPRFGYRLPNGRVQEFNPEGKHFGEGNVVTCYYNVYQPKNWTNKGVGLRSIIFENEPIYYQGASLPGGEWNTLPREEQPGAASAQPAAQQVAPAPAQAAQPQQSPWGAAPAAQPQAQAPVQQPMQQAAPAQAVAPSGANPWGAAPAGDGFAPAAGSPWA